MLWKGIEPFNFTGDQPSSTASIRNTLCSLCKLGSMLHKTHSSFLLYRANIGCFSGRYWT